MRTLQTRTWYTQTWYTRSWQSRPSLGRTGTKPVGARPLGLVLVLAIAFVIHAGQRAVHRSTVEVHGDIVGKDIVGKAWVIDGDTIDIAGSRIRLQGIDAPETDQTCTDADKKTWRCGRAATRELVGLIAGRPLRCETSGFDRYRRVLAVCALPDGSDVNAWMVRQGWALAYYSAVYRSEEAEAHAAKRGIWAGSFMPPWEWRHRHRN
jgi:endonuclease YncB( thermonuclease family)